jgi:hypothetical protein
MCGKARRRRQYTCTARRRNAATRILLGALITEAIFNTMIKALLGC